ncbi:MAG: hypothetical protein V7K89_12665 [Nostoc sp.]
MASDLNMTTVSFKIRVLGNECSAFYFLFINTLLDRRVQGAGSRGKEDFLIFAQKQEL